MSTKPPQTLIEQADAVGVALLATTTPLPKDGSAPEWVTLFPKVGRVETRDGRAFEVSAATLMAAYAEDDIYIPVDVNHATDVADLMGGRADAVGWGVALREHAGGLQARIDWLDEGRALLSARKYLYISPSFFADAGRATRLKAIALVTAPALARQPTLASARGAAPQEQTMKSIAQALGLVEAASEAECLSALGAMRAGHVAKAVHDEAIAKLSAATAELTGIKAAAREAKVVEVIDDALKAKKILPAQKDVYLAMCASDDGLANVERLLAATASAMPGSGLDARGAPAAGEAEVDPVALSLAAQAIQDERAAAGRPISMSEAVSLAAANAAKS